MKNETKGIAPLIIAVVVIVVAAGAGVGIYVATRGGGGGGGGGGDIGSANSMSCKVDATYQGTTMTYDFKAKNLQNTANFMMRIEGTVMEQSFIYIINAAQNQGWMYAEGTWLEVPIGDLSLYQTSFEGYQSQLSGWTGGDYTYTDPTTGTTVRIYDIEVNPSLDDSLFTH